MLLKHGSRGADVVSLQKKLIDKGYSIQADGIFGNATEFAVRSVQRSCGLIDDGIVGVKTAEALSGADCSGLLGIDHIDAAARRLKVEPEALFAVNQVESRGKGFFAPGKPAILFERHIMRRRLIARGVTPTSSHLDLVNTKAGGYKGGMAEYERLDRAKAIHHDAALESCSWGAFQIMGFHWEFLGYPSVVDFVERMKLDESEHFEALVRFIERQPSLHKALKTKDWRSFARSYNGPAYEKNDYHTKLQAAYESRKLRRDL